MIWRRLKFLFTGRITMWTVSEECTKDYHDCNECGGGLDHYSSEYSTYEEALYWAKDCILSQAQNDETIEDVKVDTSDVTGAVCVSLSEDYPLVAWIRKSEWSDGKRKK